jgi:hypothetical protein
MSTMISEVYDALVSAGAPEEKARKAAEAIATYDRHSADIDRRLTSLDAKILVLEGKIDGVKSELTLHRWAFGIMFAMQAAILVRVFLQN